MHHNKSNTCRGIHIVFAVFFLIALTAVNYLTFRTLMRTDASGIGNFLKILAGDGVLVLAFFLITRRSLRGLRESCLPAAAVAIAGPAFALLVVEVLLDNLWTMDISAVFANLAVYYLIFLLFTMLLGRPLLSSAAVCVLTLAAALAEYFVMEFRGQPITLFDIQSIGTAMTVAGSYSFDVTVKMGLLLQGCLGYLLLLYFLKRIRLPRSKRWLLVRLGGAACGIFCFFLLAQAAEDGSFNFWKVNENYQKKGFVYTLLWEVKYVKTEKPEGYSTEKAEAAAEEAKQNYSSNEQSAETQPQNLIVIMNESLADFSHLGEIKTDDEIMPFLSSLKENTVKGYLQVPVIGGGTSETEYEFLTGNTKQFLPAGSTAYMIYCRDPEYGIVRNLKAQGYKTIAVHPYYAKNWNRSTVYPELGFDEYYSIENWGSETEQIRYFTSDASAYEKVLDIVEENEDKVFTFLVTLQNHGSYTEETLNGFESTVTLNYDQEYPQAETYFSLLNESDQAFEDLINYFKDFDEPTMIVMFGDHFPGVEADFYTELLGKSTDELGDEEQQIIYQTPYIIWTNYDLEEEEDGGTMSANYLGSYVLKLAGLEMTTYDKFLLQLADCIPVIGRGMICDSLGSWYSLDALPQEYEESVNQYKYLQYYRISDRGEQLADIFG